MKVESLLQLQVKERCRKGIPSSVRGRAWQKLSGSVNLMNKNGGLFEVGLFSKSLFLIGCCIQECYFSLWNFSSKLDSRVIRIGLLNETLLPVFCCNAVMVLSIVTLLSTWTLKIMWMYNHSIIFFSWYMAINYYG